MKILNCKFSIGQWLRGLLLKPKRVRRRARKVVRRPGAVAQAAYRGALEGHRRWSGLAHEAVEIPAYEDRALCGDRAPHRFCWRKRWYRVVDVAALWQDSRQRGRLYVNVVALPGGVFQLYFERKKRGRGRWMLYRKMAMRSG